MKRKEIFEEYWDGFNASDSYRRHKFPDLEVTMISNRTNKTKFNESVREGDGTPLQYSCLENPMDGGAWWATAHGVAKSRTQLSNFTSHG